MCFKTFVYIVLPSHVSGLKLKVSFFVFDIFLLFPVKKAFKIFLKKQLQISNVFLQLTANLSLFWICRPSDYSVVRPWAEIRTREGRIGYSGRDTNH